MNKKVGLIPCHEYTSELVYQALKDAVELAGELAVEGKTVLLKPNILFDAPPEKSLSTHPVFLEAAIRVVREAGAEQILVGDSPGFQKPGYTGRKSGLRQVTDENDAIWVDFTAGKFNLKCPEGKVTRQFTVTSILEEVDLVISLPKLKTHQLMYYTGAMKNLFGLIPSLLKSPFHLSHPSREGFASMIVDLNTGIMAHYAFMDGIIGMEGHGPAAGNPREIGVVLASSNLLAMDVTACSLIGYAPEQIPINTEALSRGIWLDSFEEVEVVGCDPLPLTIKDFEKIPMTSRKSQLEDFLLPNVIRKVREKFAPVPVFYKAPCVYCGDCIRICPAAALEFTGRGEHRKVSVDYSKCIRCYCCHEICGVNAIDVKRKPLKVLFPGHQESKK
ncbi:MAG: DUF362 domain-containing protein [Spirochaetales bacterium]|nr:DUF362 domain-containing protein [Spirochaetales bacterium]